MTDISKNAELQQSCITAVSGSINALLSKFDNGIELYQNNAVFANCIEHLLRGGDIYKIFEQVIVMQQEQQKHYSEIIESGKIRTEIVVTKERFDELCKSIPKKCDHKNIKREDGLDECLDCGVRNY